MRVDVCAAVLCVQSCSLCSINGLIHVPGGRGFSLSCMFLSTDKLLLVIEKSTGTVNAAMVSLHF